MIQQTGIMVYGALVLEKKSIGCRGSIAILHWTVASTRTEREMQIKNKSLIQ